MRVLVTLEPEEVNEFRAGDLLRVYRKSVRQRHDGAYDVTFEIAKPELPPQYRPPAEPSSGKPVR